MPEGPLGPLERSYPSAEVPRIQVARDLLQTTTHVCSSDLAERPPEKAVKRRLDRILGGGKPPAPAVSTIKASYSKPAADTKPAVRRITFARDDR